MMGCRSLCWNWSWRENFDVDVDVEVDVDIAYDVMSALFFVVVWRWVLLSSEWIIQS